MLGALRRVHIPYTATRAGQWRGRMQLTHDPENKVLGILGMGGIGTAVAKRAVPFGMSIQYHNRHEVSKEKNAVGAKYVGFEELLRTSDVISVHLPLNDGTRGMLGRKELAMMRDDVVIVNTARGPILDETALVEALESGKVWAAGLDVYEREPIVHEGLLRNDHCVLMPHVGTASFETQRKMEELVIKNLTSVITEGKLLTPVAESKALMTKTTTTATNGVHLTKHEVSSSPPTNNNNNTIDNKKLGTETETLAQKLTYPPPAPSSPTNIEIKGNTNLSQAPPKTNGVTTTVTTEGLWNPPATPLKKPATNWLELSPSPPLRAKEKDHAGQNGDGAQAMLDSSAGEEFIKSSGVGGVGC